MSLFDGRKERLGVEELLLVEEPERLPMPKPLDGRSDVLGDVTVVLVELSRVEKLWLPLRLFPLCW